MKILLLTVGALGMLGIGGLGRQTPVEKVTLDVEVGSITKAVEQLSKATHVPMKVVGPASSDTVFLHVQDRPVEEVLTHFANAVHGEWTKSNDGAYTLKRSYKGIGDDAKLAFQQNLNDLEEWRTKMVKRLDVPFSQADIARNMAEYRTLTIHQNEKDYDASKESPANMARIEELEPINPMDRATARCIRNLNFNQIAGVTRDADILLVSNANPSQVPLPAGYGSAMSKLPEELKLWIAELKNHPAKKSDEEIDQEKQSGQSEDSTKNVEETVEARDQRLEYLAGKDPWSRTEALPSQPFYATLSFEISYENTLVCELQLFDQEGNVVLKHRSYVRSFPFNTEPEENRKGIPSDVEASPDTVALWSHFNQTEEYDEPNSPPEAKAAMQKYFDDPIGHDLLKIGNQELLTAIGERKHKSVIACLPDASFRCYGVGFATSLLIGDKHEKSVRPTESENWVEISPTDFQDHWRHRANREAMANASKEFRRNGRIEMKTLVPMACGEFGYSAEGALVRFIEEMDERWEWGMTSNSASFDHLFLALTDQQWARIARGEVIPYRELSQPQLQLISRVVYGGFKDGYVGGEAPNKVSKRDVSFELPNGLLSGGGLGGEIVFDDILVTHSPKREPKASKREYGINLTDRKEHYVQSYFGCGMRSYIPMNSLFEFRKRKRFSIHLHLSAGHYYVGDFVEGVPAHNHEKLYRYEELSPKTIERIKAHESIVDDSDREKTPPPL